MSPAPDPLVLVVEDDDGVRELLETVLAAGGYRVDTALDGLAGLVKVRVARPAVLVLDLMMPDVDGLRVLDELAAEHAEVGVLVVTGNPDAAAAARDRIGRRHVLLKPFDVEEVLARVGELAASADDPGDQP